MVLSLVFFVISLLDSGKIRKRISGKKQDIRYPLKLEKALSGGQISCKTDIRTNPTQNTSYAR